MVVGRERNLAKLKFSLTHSHTDITLVFVPRNLHKFRGANSANASSLMLSCSF